MNNTIKDALKTFSQDGVKQYLEVEKSISRHRELDVDEDEIKLAQNIINFYLESKKNEDVNELSSILGPSDLWANIIKKHHKKIIDHCNNNNASGLALTLKNIYQSKSTLGMTYPDAQNIHDSKIHRNVYAKLRVARALKEYRKKINDRLSDELANKLISILENNYGNPLLVKMFNKYVSFEALYHLLILLDLNEMLPLNKLHNKSIMDLGSGLGVVQALMMGLLEDIECTYIDLPENLIYVAWFVSKYCPNVHINFGEMNNNVSKPVINLIPYFYIDRIPLNRADLFINTFSLPEMHKNSAKKYLEFMHTILKDDGSLFSINRKDTVHGKGGEVNYTMTGISELVNSVGLFNKTKEVDIKNSFSLANDSIYPQSNIEIALYSK